MEKISISLGGTFSNAKDVTVPKAKEGQFLDAIDTITSKSFDEDSFIGRKLAKMPVSIVFYVGKLELHAIEYNGKTYMYKPEGDGAYLELHLEANRIAQYLEKKIGIVIDEDGESE